MSAEFEYADEILNHDGTDYRFMLGRGTHANTSSSPFAPKTVTGDRSYADYDAISALSLTDFSGGMGQERLTEVTRYYNGFNVDTRSGTVVLGPKVYLNDLGGTTFPATGDSYIAIGGSGAAGVYAKVATKFTTPSYMVALKRIRLFLRGDNGTGPVTVNLCANETNAPGTVLATAYVVLGELRAYGQWVSAVFSSPIASPTIIGNATYWITVENSDAAKNVYWLGDGFGTPEVEAAVIGGSATGAVYTDGAWVTNSLMFCHWADDYNTHFDTPPRLLLGSGDDGIARVWAVAGSCVYYLSATPSMTPIMDGTSAKLLPAGIHDALWHRTATDPYDKLYLALANDEDMQTWTGLSGDTWDTTTFAGFSAIKLATYSNLLVFAHDRNSINVYDGATGPDADKSLEIGTATYQIRNMVAWDGSLWVGKDDGLYEVTIPAGFPTTGSMSCVKVIDLLDVADESNFSMMLIHHGDLYFSCNNGILRYTSSKVLTPVAPDTALNFVPNQRVVFRAGVSALGALWVIAEGGVANGTSLDYKAGYDSIEIGPSVLYAYQEGSWHPVVSMPYIGMLPVRSLVVEPGWYGEFPRLWFGLGQYVAYVDMPTTTYRRWLIPNCEYVDTGYLLTSWIDGGIHTVDKDWMTVEIHATACHGGTSDTVEVLWRASENDEFVSIGTVTVDDDIQTLYFPTGSYSLKCQLKFVLERSITDATTTPRIEAVVLKYMERPDDVRSLTRVYRLEDRLEMRNGVQVTRSLTQQLEDLRTLRRAKEPLTLTTWYGKTYTVHIVDYSTSELPNEQRGTRDKGIMSVVVRYQEVETEGA